METIIGHEKPIALIKALIKKGKVPHALLFEGPEGIGKKKVALWTIQALNCKEAPGEGCGRCNTCERISRLIHPDLLLLTPQGDSLGIDQIRVAQQMLQFKPLEAVWKAVILEGADRLTEEAANAFLKTLEEPPPWTLIILLASSAESLLPTVRSRCQKIRFLPLSEREVAEVLRRMGITDIPEEAIRMGSPGRALKLGFEEVKNYLATALTGDEKEVLKVAEEIGQDKEKALTFMDYLLFEVKSKAFHSLSLRESFWKLLELKEALLEHANPRLCLESTLFELKGKLSPC